ncbi:MAG: Gfo/Idh/MocA family oxidoreductase [Ignavibacteriae bacterium]|nr:gfo/Idh/MocA family oxidoreductase [Ignavibacteriota bacterium]NOG97911.1 Gfo/Idh/MocA family oxidoreductase [Ignavibacteriota bacterium]
MLKGALIGFGKIAATTHIKVFDETVIKNRGTIVSIVEPHEMNRRKCNEEYPGIKFYKSSKELFENETLDFIVITAPPKYHAELIEEGIEQNVHILCEKPFAVSADEANLLKDKIENSGLVFMPCHQYKYSSLWKTFKNTIDNLRSGTKVLLHFNVLRKEADPGLSIFNNPWRTDLQQTSGGILADTGVHYFYLAAWMLGEPINVTAKLASLYHKNYSVEDTSVIILKFENGIAELTLTWAAHNRRNEARLYCKDLHLIYNGGTDLIKQENGNEEKTKVEDISNKKYFKASYSNLYSDFFDAINTNKNTRLNLNEAVTSIRLLNKCYQSAELNRTIRFSDE